MNGTYLIFFMQEDRTHHGILVYEWLLKQARHLGLGGGSAFKAIAGFGRHGLIHADHFIELAGDLPIEVAFMVTEEQADRRQQQPRLALEQFNNAPTDEESEQRERQDGQSKFHWRGV